MPNLGLRAWARKHLRFQASLRAHIFKYLGVEVVLQLAEEVAAGVNRVALLAQGGGCHAKDVGPGPLSHIPSTSPVAFA